MTFDGAMESFKHFARTFYEVVREAGEGFSRGRGTHLSAAMAFYTIFSLAPLTLIATAISGLVFGRDAARAEVVKQMETIMGPEARNLLLRLLENWRDPSSGLVATIVGTVTTIYLAFRVFDALRESLDLIWGIRAREDISYWDRARQYARSLSSMLIVGPMLLASLVMSEVLTRLTPYLAPWLGSMIDLGSATYFAVSFVVATLAFAVIYKWLPDVEIAWRDVFVGAIVTTVLFSIGRSLIALYLVHTSTVSVFGAAGSFVLVLFWVYYSAQILFFGAEITEVWAHRFGDGITPDRSSVHVEPKRQKSE
jgi:membrane protein